MTGTGPLKADEPIVIDLFPVNEVPAIMPT